MITTSGFKTQLLKSNARRDNDKKLLDALNVWSHLGNSEKIKVVKEIVETRNKELRLAFPDIIGIAHGFRTFTENNERKIDTEPSVTFMVESKWKSRDKGAGELPKYLYTYCHPEQSKKRELCAVPTDVESGEQYQVFPHSKKKISNKVIEAKNNMDPLNGVITCCVRIPNDKNIYILGCHHVFAMSVNLKPGWMVPEDVEIISNEVTIGRLTTYRGDVIPKNRGESFDAALAIVENNNNAISELKEVLGGLNLESHIQTVDDVGDDCKIITPNGEYDAKFVQTWHTIEGIKYFENTQNPCMSGIVEWELNTVNGKPKSGDSGSPITDPDMKTLLGMYIAGGLNQAFMLPANQLFFGPNYLINGSLKIENNPTVV